MNSPTDNPQPEEKVRQHPFRRAILRGLALVLPPLLTIVLFVWAGNIINDNVLVYVEAAAKYISVQIEDDTLTGIPAAVVAADVAVKDVDGRTRPLSSISGINAKDDGIDRLVSAHNATIVSIAYQGEVYVPLANQRQWIRQTIYDAVHDSPGDKLPATAEGYYQRYAEVAVFWVQRETLIPIFLCAFILILYFLGKFLAAGVGRILWNAGESVVHRLPIIRNVYSSVKQVTDFALSENEIEFTRIVAVEYPRRGVWSIGFVTGEGMAEICEKAGEPVLSVLMPTSPMPATGFTIQVRKSETIDLKISMDQAIQFVVSCGVVVPAHQQTTVAADRIAASISQARGNGTGANPTPVALIGTGDAAAAPTVEAPSETSDQ